MSENKLKGLYDKFKVWRTDGSSEPGGKHENCQYFVLDLTHDKYALPAIDAYRRACGKEYPALARDLNIICANMGRPLTIQEDENTALRAELSENNEDIARWVDIASRAGGYVLKRDKEIERLNKRIVSLVKEVRLMAEKVRLKKEADADLADLREKMETLIRDRSEKENGCTCDSCLQLTERDIKQKAVTP